MVISAPREGLFLLLEPFHPDYSFHSIAGTAVSTLALLTILRPVFPGLIRSELLHPTVSNVYGREGVHPHWYYTTDFSSFIQESSGCSTDCEKHRQTVSDAWYCGIHSSSSLGGRPTTAPPPPSHSPHRPPTAHTAHQPHSHGISICIVCVACNSRLSVPVHS